MKGRDGSASPPGDSLSNARRENERFVVRRHQYFVQFVNGKLQAERPE